MDRGAWQITTVHSIAELDMTEHIHTCMTYLRQRFKSLTKLPLITLLTLLFEVKNIKDMTGINITVHVKLDNMQKDPILRILTMIIQ